MSTESPSTTDRAERYSLDEIRTYLAGPPTVADHRHHKDIDRMAWLVDLHDSTRDQLHRVADENRRLQERLDTAEGRLAKWKALHTPERRYTPDDGETSYATYAEAADASFDGVGTPRSVTFFEVCVHCASIEIAEGCEHDYKESLWPCKDAVASGLGKEPSDG